MVKLNCLGLVGLLFLIGCGAQPIMPPVQYNKPIDFHVKKTAALQWELGKNYSSRVARESYHQPGMIEALALSIDQNNNPSRYTLSYGKAQQAIFMTSLKNVLDRNQVFKEIELVTDPNEISAKDVVIAVFFKTARVASPERAYSITLSVVMTITSQGKPPFKRTYLVQNDDEVLRKGFIAQQSDVSERLLEKVIAGIEEWHKLERKRG